MKKKLFAVLLAAALILALSLPCLAYGDYELAYDGTGELDTVFLESYNETLSALSDKYHTEIRADIAADAENVTALEAAENLRSNYGYGYPDTGDGISLTLLARRSDDGGMYIDGFAVYGYGANQALAQAESFFTEGDYINACMEPGCFEGDLDADRNVLMNILANYASGADQFLTSISAGTDSVPGSSAAYVHDLAGILTAEEISALEAKAAEVSARYECGVYIAAVEDYTVYDSFSVFDAATAFYKENSMGWGTEKSGELLLLSMSERDYSLIAYGYGNTAFTDYGKDLLEDEFLDDFRDNDWYSGFCDYIDASANMLSEARGGNPVDIAGSQGGNHYYEDYHGEYNGETSGVTGTAIAMALGIPALIALFVCLIFKRQMRSVYAGGSADEYIAPGGVDMRVSTDRFLYTSESRVKVESDNHGSRGGTSISSGGFSGRSGKF